MDEVALKVILHLVSGVKSKQKLAYLIGIDAKELNSILELLQNLRLVQLKQNSVQLTANIDEIVRLIVSNMQSKSLDVPFTTKIVSKGNYKYMVIPAYVVRTFDIRPGDLIVVRMGDLSFSGTLSTKKSIFYIHKRYWGMLGLKDDEVREVNLILDKVYRRVGGGEFEELTPEIPEPVEEETCGGE